MTLKEAEQEWDKLVWFVIRCCARAGIEYKPHDDRTRASYLYEYMSGDLVPPHTRYRLAREPEFRLSFWAEKFRQFKGIDPELTSFLVDQINAARRGA
jgi:hypothetical protein